LNKFREYDHRVTRDQGQLATIDGHQDPVKCLELIGKLKEHQGKMIEALEGICLHVASNPNCQAMMGKNQRFLERSHRWKFSPSHYDISVLFNRKTLHITCSVQPWCSWHWGLPIMTDTFLIPDQ